jgi:hypothetical protein
MVDLYKKLSYSLFNIQTPSSHLKHYKKLVHIYIYRQGRGIHDFT